MRRKTVPVELIERNIKDCKIEELAELHEQQSTA